MTVSFLPRISSEIVARNSCSDVGSEMDMWSEFPQMKIVRMWITVVTDWHNREIPGEWAIIPRQESKPSQAETLFSHLQLEWQFLSWKCGNSWRKYFLDYSTRAVNTFRISVVVS
jgi:hypothetical protein